MKFTKIYGLLCAGMLLASCESSVDGPDANDGRALRIATVSQTGFEPDAATRTTYSDSYATVFEEGDRLGLVLVDAAGNRVANVPFTYTAAGTWNNDLNQLYLSDVEKIVAYFPYNEALPTDACDAEAVKASVKIAPDQSDRESFTAADLLVCEIARPGADLDIAFSHAFSMLRFSARGTVTAGAREYEYSVALDGLQVNVDGIAYTPCYMNGGYVMIVKNDLALQPEMFKYTYTRFGEDRATKTITREVSTAAGTVFSFPCPSAGGASAGLTAGDYYCAAVDDGATVIIPAGAAAIPDGLVCQGIVFHVMDNGTFSTFAADNGLDASKYPGFGGKHGLIVSLRPGGLLLSGYNAGDIAHNEFLKSVFADFEASGDTEVSLGYRLTQILSAAYAGGNAGVTFTGLDGFDLPLTDCTAWYIPSFNELKYLIRGDKAPSLVSLDGQEMINKRLTIAAGTLLEGSQPSVSYKLPDGFCIMQAGEEMGWHGVPDGENCRPICAF